MTLEYLTNIFVNIFNNIIPKINSFFKKTLMNESALARGIISKLPKTTIIITLFIKFLELKLEHFFNMIPYTKLNINIPIYPKS